MKTVCVSLLLPLFFGTMVMAHPTVARCLEAPREQAAQVPAARPSIQLPTISYGVTLPPRTVASAYTPDGEGVLRIVNARIALLKATEAIRFGLLGMLCSPFIVVAGLNLTALLLSAIAGIVFTVWGAVWFIISVPVFIGGLIAAAAARDELDKAELGVAALDRHLGRPTALQMTLVRF